MRHHSSSGFSLIEVMIASAVLAGAVLSIAELFAAATASTAQARETGEATMLAWQKVEQLRSLAFACDGAGQPVTDRSFDTAAVPERAFGGTGLAVSPAGVLLRDTAGYVDYLDALGQPLGGDAGPPAGSHYRRRWAVALAGGNPDLLVVRVRVLPMGHAAEAASVATLRARQLP